jgi:hypothetical protein
MREGVLESESRLVQKPVAARDLLHGRARRARQRHARPRAASSGKLIQGGVERPVDRS